MNYSDNIHSLDTNKPLDYQYVLQTVVDYWFIIKLTIFNLFWNLFLGIIGSYIACISIFMGYITYLMISMILYLVHRVGHMNLIGFWYRAHTLGHHIQAYPVKKFLTKNYKIDKQSYVATTLLFMILSPIFLLSIKYSLAYNWLQTSVIGVYVIIISLVEDNIHYQIHMQHSWLNKYLWFQQLRYLHFLHHKDDMMRNYAMKDFYIDLLTGNLILST